MEAVDILVTSSDTGHQQLVAEVQLTARDIERASGHLARYMFQMGIPCGLVVAGNRMRVFRNTYEASDVSSVRCVAESTTDGVRELTPPGRDASAYEFEARVQDWLTSMQDPWRVHDLPQPIRSVVEEHVAPWVAAGVVHAAGPRFVE